MNKAPLVFFTAFVFCVLTAVPAEAYPTLQSDGSYNFTFYHLWEPGDGPAELTNGQIGENQLSVNVRGAGLDSLTGVNVDSSQVLFTFRNDGPDLCYIAGVHFYDGALLGISDFYESPGVDFKESDKDLPGIGSVLAAYEADENVGSLLKDKKAANGVNNDPDEWLAVLFDLVDPSVMYPDPSFDDVIAGMMNGAVIVGVKLQGFANEGSEAFTTIPAPGALLFGSIGVGLVGWLRRRRTL